MRLAGLLIVLPLLGCADRDSEASRGQAAGRATGAVGPGAEALLESRRAEEAPDEPIPPDSGWTSASAEVVRGTPAVQQELRTARHAGFDRIVLDFGDGPLPGHRVAYVDGPVTACGSGEVVALPGSAWLAITLTPAAAHDDEGRATVSNRDRPLDLPTVLHLRSTCDFEGIVTWVAALRAPAAFRVLALDAPARLVIDVRH